MSVVGGVPCIYPVCLHGFCINRIYNCINLFIHSKIHQTTNKVKMNEEVKYKRTTQTEQSLLTIHYSDVWHSFSRCIVFQNTVVPLIPRVSFFVVYVYICARAECQIIHKDLLSTSVDPYL